MDNKPLDETCRPSLPPRQHKRAISDSFFRLGTSFDLRLRNQNIREFGQDATIPINPLMISRLQRYRLEDIQRFIAILEGYVDQYGTITAALSELFPNLGNSGDSVQKVERVNIYMYPTGPEPRVNQRNIVFG